MTFRCAVRVFLGGMGAGCRRVFGKSRKEENWARLSCAQGPVFAATSNGNFSVTFEETVKQRNSAGQKSRAALLWSFGLRL